MEASSVINPDMEASGGMGGPGFEVMGRLQSSVINLEMETSEVLGGLQASFIN